MDQYTADIVNKSNYVNPSRYISGRIVEYDMRSANISVLLQKGRIDKELYDRLSMMPKMFREKHIGLMEKEDPTLYTALAEGIREYRIKFIEANNIDGINIIRIANDAMYINTSIDLPYTKFDDYIEFRSKSVSNAIVNINKIIVLVSFLEYGDINIDVKGISDDKMNLHINYMLNIIGTTIWLLERASVEDSLSYITNTIELYIKKQLDLGFYREFNSDSMYIINTTRERFGIATDIDYKYKDYIDTSYNLNILRELWSIILEIYNKRRK